METYIAKAYLSHEGKMVNPEEEVKLTAEQAYRLGDKVQATGDTDKPVSLDEFTVNELKSLAEGKDLEFDNKIKKADLIELIEQGV